MPGRKYLATVYHNFKLECLYSSVEISRGFSTSAVTPCAVHPKLGFRIRSRGPQKRQDRPVG